MKMSKHPANFKHPRQDLTNTLPPSQSHKDMNSEGQEDMDSQEPVQLREFLTDGDVMTIM